MIPDGWTPRDLLAAGDLLVRAVEFIATLLLFIFVVLMRKDVNGRFSQLIDLISRLSGAPNQRLRDEPVEVERRAKKNAQ